MIQSQRDSDAGEVMHEKASLDETFWWAWGYHTEDALKGMHEWTKCYSLYEDLIQCWNAKKFRYGRNAAVNTRTFRLWENQKVKCLMWECTSQIYEVDEPCYMISVPSASFQNTEWLNSNLEGTGSRRLEGRVIMHDDRRQCLVSGYSMAQAQFEGNRRHKITEMRSLYLQKYWVTWFDACWVIYYVSEQEMFQLWSCSHTHIHEVARAMPSRSTSFHLDTQGCPSPCMPGCVHAQMCSEWPVLYRINIKPSILACTAAPNPQYRPIISKRFLIPFIAWDANSKDAPRRQNSPNHQPVFWLVYMQRAGKTREGKRADEHGNPLPIALCRLHSRQYYHAIHFFVNSNKANQQWRTIRQVQTSADPLSLWIAQKSMLESTRCFIISNKVNQQWRTSRQVQTSTHQLCLWHAQKSMLPSRRSFIVSNIFGTPASWKMRASVSDDVA